MPRFNALHLILLWHIIARRSGISWLIYYITMEVIIYFKILYLILPHHQIPYVQILPWRGTTLTIRVIKEHRGAALPGCETTLFPVFTFVIVKISSYTNRRWINPRISWEWNISDVPMVQPVWWLWRPLHSQGLLVHENLYKALSTGVTWKFFFSQVPPTVPAGVERRHEAYLEIEENEVPVTICLDLI